MEVKFHHCLTSLYFQSLVFAKKQCRFGNELRETCKIPMLFVVAFRFEWDVDCKGWVRT